MARILRNWLFVDKFVYTHTLMWFFLALFSHGILSDVRRLSE